jgi:hypothetical protein
MQVRLKAHSNTTQAMQAANNASNTRFASNANKHNTLPSKTSTMPATQTMQAAHATEAFASNASNTSIASNTSTRAMQAMQGHCLFRVTAAFAEFFIIGPAKTLPQVHLATMSFWWFEEKTHTVCFSGFEEIQFFKNEIDLINLFGPKPVYGYL